MTTTALLGPVVQRLHVAGPDKLGITLTNTSGTHATFVDLLRLETGREGRVVLEPNETITATLAPGDVDLTLGRYAQLEVA